MRYNSSEGASFLSTKDTSEQAAYRLLRLFQKSERAHCAAPPFQIEPASLGFDLVLGAISKENRFYPLIAAQKFPPSFRFRLRRKLHCGGSFFAFRREPLGWVRGGIGTGIWAEARVFFVPRLRVKI